MDFTKINWQKYNPFKMWGAWLGGIIAVVMPPVYRTDLALINPSVYTIYLLTLLSVIVSFVVGFLIGWGIHSLLKK